MYRYIISDECNILEVNIKIIQGLSVAAPDESFLVETPFWVIEICVHRPGGSEFEVVQPNTTIIIVEFV